uniref:Uncharacterized protein n=1 Tax=Timema cristinae TaxID=61476 RepID=A0A7R9DGR9_TIMCR|nr:unnamed protein product [Timema cristinae]
MFGSSATDWSHFDSSHVTPRWREGQGFDFLLRLDGIERQALIRIPRDSGGLGTFLSSLQTRDSGGLGTFLSSLQNTGLYEYDGDSEYEGNSEYEDDSEYEGDSEYDGNSEYEGDNEYEGDSGYDGGSEYDGNSEYDDNSEYEGDSEYDGNSEYEGDNEYEGDSGYDGGSEYDGNSEYDDNSEYEGDREYDSDCEGDSDSECEGDSDSPYNSQREKGLSRVEAPYNSQGEKGLSRVVVSHDVRVNRITHSDKGANLILSGFPEVTGMPGLESLPVVFFPLKCLPHSYVMPNAIDVPRVLLAPTPAWLAARYASTWKVLYRGRPESVGRYKREDEDSRPVVKIHRVVTASTRHPSVVLSRKRPRVKEGQGQTISIPPPSSGREGCVGWSTGQYNKSSRSRRTMRGKIWALFCSSSHSAHSKDNNVVSSKDGVYMRGSNGTATGTDASGNGTAGAGDPTGESMTFQGGLAPL